MPCAEQGTRADWVGLGLSCPRGDWSSLRLFRLLLPAVTLRPQDSVPGDVYPDSRSRLPLVKPGDSDEPGRQVPAAALANCVGIQTMGAALGRYGYRGGIVQSDSTSPAKENPMSYA